MSGLRSFAQALIQRQVFLDRSGTAGIGTHIEQHVFLLKAG